MGVIIPPPAPDRSADEGEGPFDRLVIENVMLVNGLGAPPRGPVSIVVTGNTIEKISGYPPKPQPGERRLDGKGMTALPGFIDAHVHIANPYEGMVGPITPPEYVFKLWLGHGITTVRDTGSVMGLEWTVGQSESERRATKLPRLTSFPTRCFLEPQWRNLRSAQKKVLGPGFAPLRSGVREASSYEVERRKP